VKVVYFILKKFSIFLLQVYSKKVTEISCKAAIKVSTLPKTVYFKEYLRYRY